MRGSVSDVTAAMEAAIHVAEPISKVVSPYSDRIPGS